MKRPDILKNTRWPRWLSRLIRRLGAIPSGEVLDSYACPAQLRANILRYGPRGYDLYSDEQLAAMREGAQRSDELDARLRAAMRSLPVSSAKVLAIADEIAAFAYESNSRHDHCAAIGLVEAARSHKEDAFAYEWCATMLRRRAASMTERQPEENREGETRRPSAPHSR